VFQRVFPAQRMHAYWDIQTEHTRVPVTFGLPVD
jgi:hypothetical protein